MIQVDEAAFKDAATVDVENGAPPATLLRQLAKAFPSSSVIETGPMLRQARDLLSQMSLAILAAASVAVLAGIAVLLGAIAAARAARTYDSVILRVLGASQRQLLLVQLGEYALLALVLALRALINRSRLGLALHVIGEDETVATHVGINTTHAKVLLFTVSAVFITVTGAIMAPRWTYIDPSIAFAPAISFQTLIMALLGGAGALFGPILGAVPLVLLFEYLSANFPNHFSILLGLVFIVIVYFIPQGLSGVLAKLFGKSSAQKVDKP